MKKNLVVLVVLAIVVLSLMSCSKKDDALNVPVKKEQVKIYMSSANSPTSLKSASTTGSIERTSIANGDTVDVVDIKGINSIFSAETDQGFKVDGSWQIYMVDAEDYQYDDNMLLQTPGNYFESSIIAIKLNMFGLYQAKFRQQNGAEIIFYVRHSGIPGDIGDDWVSDYSFRMEKNVYQHNGNEVRKAYCLFLRYYDGEFGNFTDNSLPDPNLEKNFQAIVWGKNVSMMTPAGFKISAKHFNLHKCKYSKNFVKLIFFEDEVVPENGIYRIMFFSGGEYGNNYWFFPSFEKTSWKKRGEINFKAF